MFFDLLLPIYLFILQRYLRDDFLEPPIIAVTISLTVNL